MNRSREPSHLSASVTMGEEVGEAADTPTKAVGWGKAPGESARCVGAATRDTLNKYSVIFGDQW